MLFVSAASEQLRVNWLRLQDDPLITIRDASHLLAVSVPAIRKWIKRGVLRGVRVAGRYRVRRSEVLRVAGVTVSPEQAK